MIPMFPMSAKEKDSRAREDATPIENHESTAFAPSSGGGWSVAAGMLCILAAIYGFFDDKLCSRGCGGYTMRQIYDWIHSIFGHWGVIAFLIGSGLLCIRHGLKELPDPTDDNTKQEPSKDVIEILDPDRTGQTRH